MGRNSSWLFIVFCFCLSFRQVIPYLLASILYHRSFIFENLPKKHPIFLQRFWDYRYLSLLFPNLQAGTEKNEMTKMTASGIPPNILLANEITTVKEDLQIMDQGIKRSLEELPETIKRNMLDNFQINGAVYNLLYNEDRAMMQPGGNHHKLDFWIFSRLPKIISLSCC